MCMCIIDLYVTSNAYDDGVDVAIIILAIYGTERVLCVEHVQTIIEIFSVIITYSNTMSILLYSFAIKISNYTHRRHMCGKY